MTVQLAATPRFFKESSSASSLARVALIACSVNSSNFCSDAARSGVPAAGAGAAETRGRRVRTNEEKVENFILAMVS